MAKKMLAIVSDDAGIPASIRELAGKEVGAEPINSDSCGFGHVCLKSKRTEAGFPEQAGCTGCFTVAGHLVPARYLKDCEGASPVKPAADCAAFN